MCALQVCDCVSCNAPSPHTHTRKSATRPYGLAILVKIGGGPISYTALKIVENGGCAIGDKGNRLTTRPCKTLYVPMFCLWSKKSQNIQNAPKAHNRKNPKSVIFLNFKEIC